MSRYSPSGPYTVVTFKQGIKSWSSVPEHERLTLARAKRVFGDLAKLAKHGYHSKIVAERTGRVIALRRGKLDRLGPYGPYAAPDDFYTARDCGITVAQLRRDRMRDDKRAAGITS